MEKDIIYEYESVLLGKKAAISGYFFGDNSARNEYVALTIIRCAVETYLRWDPEQVRDFFGPDVIKRMKLEQVMKYVRFPPEADKDRDFYIIAAKLYPKKIKINVKEMALLIYKRVIAGDLYKFPKGFFVGNKGVNRALMCFQYMLMQYTSFGNQREMYEYFYGAKGTKLLKEYKLSAACVAMYEYPIDFLHEALPTHMKNEFWYRYYRFMISNNEQIRTMKKDGTFKG